MSLLDNIKNTVESLALDRAYYQSIGYLDKSLGARYILSVYSEFEYLVTQIGARF